MISVKQVLPALLFSMTLVNVTAVVAEEKAATPAVSQSSSGALSLVISKIDAGLIEVSKSDFSAATILLKAAREASDQIPNKQDAKPAYEALVQGMIQVKGGNVAKATEYLTKAKEGYSAIK